MDIDEEPDGLPEPELTKPTPTKTMPGSKERVEVYLQRVELGQELWHDDDATIQELTGCSDQE